jgi:hypothetical protein
MYDASAWCSDADQDQATESAVPNSPLATEIVSIRSRHNFGIIVTSLGHLKFIGNRKPRLRKLMAS